MARTPRQKTIKTLEREGLTVKQIAARLGISTQAVYAARLYKPTGNPRGRPIQPLHPLPWGMPLVQEYRGKWVKP